MANSLRFNVGATPGLNGTGVVYLGKAASGREFLFVRHDHDGNAGTDNKNLFLSRSSIVNQIRTGATGVQLAEVVNYSNLMETADDGLLDVDGYITLDNAPTNVAFLRLWDGTVTLFSVKGTNITTVPTNKNIITSTNLDAWMAGTLSSGANAATGGDGGTGGSGTPTSKTLWEQAQDFATQNPALTILIVLGIILGLIWLYNNYGGGKKRRKRR
ncbi:hypothetical protein [Runella sp.]|uniref:hypothetical protein n=1 Tax=Runella sp. TaxID=1960881 RepID=UPI003D11AFF5